MEPVGHCPFVGLKQNRAIRFSSPTSEHRCYIHGNPIEIPVNQETFCLSHNHVQCPLYTGLTTATIQEPISVVPPSVTQAASPVPGWFAALSSRDRIVYGIMLALLAGIVVIYLITGFQSLTGMPDIADRTATAQSTSQIIVNNPTATATVDTRVTTTAVLPSPTALPTSIATQRPTEVPTRAPVFFPPTFTPAPPTTALPATGVASTAVTNASQQPVTNVPQLPATQAPATVIPATSAPRPPATSAPRPPATSAPRPPATSAPRPPATSAPRPPATRAPATQQPSATRSPAQPTVPKATARPQPPEPTAPARVPTAVPPPPPTAVPTAVPPPPPTAVPTAVPPTAVPTAVPPTAVPTAVPPTAVPPVAERRNEVLWLYFGDTTGTLYVPVQREVSVENKQVARAAVQALIAGPRHGLTQVLDPAAQLLDLHIENGTAIVNFDRNPILDGRGRDALALTLTHFSTIQRVQLQVHGQNLDGPRARPVLNPVNPLGLPLDYKQTEFLPLYFISVDGSHQVRIIRMVPKTDQTAEGTVRALLEGPGPYDYALRRVIPAGTELRSVIVEGGVVTVDLTQPFTAAENRQAATRSLTASLTTLPGVKGVRILIDGRQLSDYWGEGYGGVLPRPVINGE